MTIIGTVRHRHISPLPPCPHPRLPPSPGGKEPAPAAGGREESGRGRLFPEDGLDGCACLFACLLAVKFERAEEDG